MSLLYLAHFGLNKPPFKITPDPDFFFSGGRRGDTLSALLYVARHEEGIITVVAEVGSGKTMLSRLMISRLSNDVSTVYLPNPCFSRDEILSAIARDLGLSNLPLSLEARLSALQQELLRRHALGQRVLLVVDEAHAMPPESLEEIRLLSNLETENYKLVNIMLCGQPELDNLLADPRLRQVRDRVIHRFELQALSADETCAYIDHRVRAAGWKGAALFAPKALAHVVRAAGGRVRRINLLADKALLGAFSKGDIVVQGQHVVDAINELYVVSSRPGLSKSGLVWQWAVASVALASAIAVLAVWQLEPYRHGGGYARANGVNQDKGAVAPAASPAQAQSQKNDEALAVQAQLTAAAVTDVATQPEAGVADIEAYLTRTHLALKPPGLKGYALQLAAIPPVLSALDYLKLAGRHLDPALVYAQLSTYNGRNFVAVYYGKYDTPDQARTALAALPEVLKTNKPIVRTWAKIKMEGASEKTNNHELF